MNAQTRLEQFDEAISQEPFLQQLLAHGYIVAGADVRDNALYRDRDHASYIALPMKQVK